MINYKQFIPDESFFDIKKEDCDLLFNWPKYNIFAELRYSEKAMEHLESWTVDFKAEKYKLFVDFVKNGYCKNLIDLIVLNHLYNDCASESRQQRFEYFKEVLKGEKPEPESSKIYGDILKLTHGFFVSYNQFNLVLNRITDCPITVCDDMRRFCQKTLIDESNEMRTRFLRSVIHHQLKERYGEEDSNNSVINLLWDESKMVTPTLIDEINDSDYINFLVSYFKLMYPKKFDSTIGKYNKKE